MKKIIVYEVLNERIKEYLKISNYVDSIDYSSNYIIKIGAKHLNNTPIKLIINKNSITIENIADNPIECLLTEDEFVMILVRCLNNIKCFKLDEINIDSIIKNILTEINSYVIK